MNNEEKYSEELTDDQVAYLHERAAERRETWERHKEKHHAMPPPDHKERT